MSEFRRRLPELLAKVWAGERLVVVHRPGNQGKERRFVICREEKEMNDLERWLLADYIKSKVDVVFDPHGPTDSLLGYWSRMVNMPRPGFSETLANGWDEADSDIKEEE